MRVYHFVNEEYGLEDLQRKRLKVATIQDLNDPFELLGTELSNEMVRRAFKVMKEELSREKGLLCFSRDWHNPVQWSHYADKHRGFCLGFDVPKEKLGEVSYSGKRLAADIDKLRFAHQIDPKIIAEIFFTKYAHWKYENEVRSFVNLNELDPEKKLYFVDFSDELKLTEVIVGANSSVTRDALRQALGDNASSTKVIKARLAFKSFEVVRQKNEKLWF